MRFRSRAQKRIPNPVTAVFKRVGSPGNSPVQVSGYKVSANELRGGYFRYRLVQNMNFFILVVIRTGNRWRHSSAAAAPGHVGPYNAQ